MHRFWASLFLVPALALGLGAALPEHPGRIPFRGYGPDQGLRDTSLHSIAQDGQGHIWLGTENGLLCYDGLHFQRWGTAQGLPNAWVRQVLPARGGGVWVSANNQFVRLKEGRVEPPAILGESGVVEGYGDLDNDGYLWVLAQGGLLREREDGRLVRLPGIPDGGLTSFAFGRHTGTAHCVVDGRLFDRLPEGRWVAPLEGSPPSERITSVAEDGTGRVWAMAGRSLWFRDPGQAAFQDAAHLLPAPPFSDAVLSLDRHGRVWVPTNHGLLIVQGGNVERLGPAEGLPLKWTRRAFLDREDNLWVLGSGLFRRLGQDFVRVHTASEGLENDLVWALHRDPRGRLWAGTHAGVFQLGPRGWGLLPGTEGLAVGSIADDPRGGLWISAFNGRLRHLPAGTHRATEAPLLPAPGQPLPDSVLRSDSNLALHLDRQGQLWVATAVGGLLRVDPLRRQILAKENPCGIDSARLAVTRIQEDTAGRLWLASNRGVFRLENGIWTCFTEGLRSPRVLGLRPDSDQGFWVWYDEPLGLDHVIPEGRKLRLLEHLDSHSGLPSDLVYDAVPAPPNLLWVATNRGVTRREAQSTRHFGLGHGLPSEDCSQNGLLLDPDGSLWAATDRGLARFRGSKLPPALAAPATLVESVGLPGRNLRPGPDLGFLAHQEATLEFRFAAPTFVDERAVQYQLRLQGLEKEWRDTDVRVARFPALPAGTYRFEARARYPGGGWGTSAVANFRVRSPWWQSWWFRLLVAAGAAWLLTLYIGFRLRKLSRLKHRLEGLVEDRTRQLQQSNQALTSLNDQLKSALSEVRTLQGLIPICAHCKKIRDDGGYWSQMETYIQNRTEAQFTHGICPECTAELMPEYYRSLTDET